MLYLVHVDQSAKSSTNKIVTCSHNVSVSVTSSKQCFVASWEKSRATLILLTDLSHRCALLGKLMRQIISEEVVLEI